MPTEAVARARVPKKSRTTARALTTRSSRAHSGSSVVAQAHVGRCFLGISLLWAVTGSVNASVALWLQFTQSVGTFVVTKSPASFALTVVAVAISVWWFRRSVSRPAPIPAPVPIAA